MKRLCFLKLGLAAGALLLCTIGATAAEPIKVACVGDSITYGAAIKDREKNCYPAQLQELLGEGYHVKNFGNSGSTMLKRGDKPYWKQKEFGAAKAFLPDVVVIKLGTNDSKPQNWQYSENFSADYRAMIREFRELKSRPKIYICLAAPAFEERWGIREGVIRKEQQPALHGIAKRERVFLIDLFTPLDGKEAHFPDKIHPNAAGAKIIAETVAKVLKPVASD